MAGRSPCHHLDGGQNTDGGQRARTLARPSHRRDGDRRAEILQECRYIDNVAVVRCVAGSILDIDTVMNTQYLDLVSGHTFAHFL